MLLVAQSRKKPICPSTDGGIHNVGYSYNGILFGHIKEGDTDIYGTMDEPWKYHADWKEPETKGHML